MQALAEFPEVRAESGQPHYLKSLKDSGLQALPEYENTFNIWPIYGWSL